MTTFVRSGEAARILGVSKPTLYAYVSRGRVDRTTAADGRTSLFSRDELEALAAGRRTSVAPRPTIDVQIASAITVLAENGVRIRGHDLTQLVSDGQFEDVAELLWTDNWSPGTTWQSVNRADQALIAHLADLDLPPVPRLAVAAHLLDAAHPGDEAATAARRLLAVAPGLLGSQRTSGRYAHRLAAAWNPAPPPTLVQAVDTALCLLADHELATSTLAVRVAASVRASPYGAIATGLATVDGALHGSASLAVHRLLERCSTEGTASVIGQLRAERRLVPGFGHKVYRSVDPRFTPLMEAVRPLDTNGDRINLIDEVQTEVGRTISQPPNIDLALGALTWVADLDERVPIFAVARIAGWAAHYAEELDEAPVRYRGLARTP